MNISVETQDLTYATALAQQVSKDKSPVPIVSSVVFRATEDGVIFVYATDLEISLKSRIQGEVHEAGAVCLPAKKFFNMLQSLSNDYPVHIIGQRNDRCLIKSGRGQYRLAGFEVAEFPEMVEYNQDSEDEDQKVMVIDAHQFRMAIDQTVFATSTDSNEVLNSVHFNFDEQSTEVVATDRFCLSLVNLIPENSSGVNDKKLTLSQTTVKQLRKVFATSFTITVMIEDNMVIFTDATNTLTARLIAGDYIDYKAIIQIQDYQGTAIIPRKVLVDAVRRINVISSLVKGNVMTLHVESGEQGPQLRIETEVKEEGDAEEILSVEEISGEISITVNSETIIKALNSMRSDTVKLVFDQPTKPLYIEAVGDDLQNDHTCLIMPMRAS